MISMRKAKDRFHTQIDWLDSWHTFSFGDHYDPNYEGFRALRVINDDIRMQKAERLLDGPGYVLPDDVKVLAALVLPHRILMTPEAELDGAHADAVVTATPGVAVGVSTADCGPILFADAEAGVVTVNAPVVRAAG